MLGSELVGVSSNKEDPWREGVTATTLIGGVLGG